MIERKDGTKYIAVDLCSESEDDDHAFPRSATEPESALVLYKGGSSSGGKALADSVTTSARNVVNVFNGNDGRRAEETMRCYSTGTSPVPSSSPYSTGTTPGPLVSRSSAATATAMMASPARLNGESSLVLYNAQVPGEVTMSRELVPVEYYNRRPEYPGRNGPGQDLAAQDSLSLVCAAASSEHQRNPGWNSVYEETNSPQYAKRQAMIALNTARTDCDIMNSLDDRSKTTAVPVTVKTEGTVKTETNTPAARTLDFGSPGPPAASGVESGPSSIRTFSASQLLQSAQRQQGVLSDEAPSIGKRKRTQTELSATYDVTVDNDRIELGRHYADSPVKAVFCRISNAYSEGNAALKKIDSSKASPMKWNGSSTVCTIRSREEVEMQVIDW